MPGVRLTHPTLRGTTYTIEVKGRPYTQPLACPVCKGFHENKTYHLNLDAEGGVIVSEEIYETLRRQDIAPLRFENPVAAPPAIGLSVGSSGGFILKHPTLRACIFVVEDPARPYTTAYSCSECQRQHEHKTYHLKLDTDGKVSVSKSVFEALQALPVAFAGMDVLSAEDFRLTAAGPSNGSYRVVAHTPGGKNG